MALRSFNKKSPAPLLLVFVSSGNFMVKKHFIPNIKNPSPHKNIFFLKKSPPQKEIKKIAPPQKKLYLFPFLKNIVIYGWF